MPAQLGDHTVRAASTPVRDGKGTPLHFEKIRWQDIKKAISPIRRVDGERCQRQLLSI